MKMGSTLIHSMWSLCYCCWFSAPETKYTVATLGGPYIVQCRLSWVPDCRYVLQWLLHFHHHQQCRQRQWVGEILGNWLYRFLNIIEESYLKLWSNKTIFLSLSCFLLPLQSQSVVISAVCLCLLPANQCSHVSVHVMVIKYALLGRGDLICHY